MENILNALIAKLDIDNKQIKLPIRGLKGYTLYQLIEALISTDTLEEASNKLGYSINPVKTSIREHIAPFFPERKKAFGCGGMPTWRYTLLAYIEHKKCNQCNRILPYSAFNNHSTVNKLGINSICGSCQSFNSKNYKSSIDNRKPKWADDSEILEIYSNCPKGMHVDHIVPLKGELVSGLHVQNNLQYLTPQDNMSKKNKFDINTADIV